jgi:hypothetical protein
MRAGITTWLVAHEFGVVLWLGVGLGIFIVLYLLLS